MKNGVKTGVERLPTHEQIAKRAHEIYLANGAKADHQIDDWLQAEYELMQLPVSKIAELNPAKPGGHGHRIAIVGLVQAGLLLASTGISQLGG